MSEQKKIEDFAKELEQEVIDLLEGFDFPKDRGDITNPDNLRWLGRNLFIKNRNNIQLNDVLPMLCCLHFLRTGNVLYTFA